MYRPNMDWRDAVELVKLRIVEDGVKAGEAVREMQTLTGCTLHDCRDVFYEFQALYKQHHKN